MAFVFISLTSFSLKRKVSFIYIKHELNIAAAIQKIKVYGYTDSTMLYGIGNLSDTLVIRSKRGKFLNLLKTVKVVKDKHLNQELGGSWPAIGQSVLMISDTNNLVKLFAFKVDTCYRFWDPNSIPFANSIFLIPKEKNFKQLPICAQAINAKDFYSCSDGCMVDASIVILRN